MQATKLNLACWLLDNSAKAMITAVPTGTHHFPRGEPLSHGTTVYGEIPPTYNIYDGSSRCVRVSQPILF